MTQTHTKGGSKNYYWGEIERKRGSKKLLLGERDRERQRETEREGEVQTIIRRDTHTHKRGK